MANGPGNTFGNTGAGADSGKVENSASANQKLLDILKRVREEYESQNDTLSSNLNIQNQITDSLRALRKETQGHNAELNTSISLSSKVAKALQNSVSAGENINQIEKAINKNKNLDLQITQQIGALNEDAKLTNDDIFKIGEEHLKLLEEEERIELELAELRKEQENLEDELLKVAQEKNVLLERRSNLEQQLLDKNPEIAKAAQNEINLLDKSIDVLDKKADTIEKTNLGLDHEVDLRESSLGSLKGQLATSKEMLPIEEQQLLKLIESKKNLEDAQIKLEHHLDLHKKIANAMGLTGQGLEAINALFGGQLKGLGEIEKAAKQRIQDIIEEGDEYDENGNKILKNVSALRGFGIVLSEIGKSIISNMLDPMVLVAAAFKFDKELVEMQKRMMLTNEEAQDLRTELDGIAAASENSAVNSERLLKAFGTIQTQIGFSSEKFKVMAEDAVTLMENIGLSAEATGNISKASILSGQSIKENQMIMQENIQLVELENGLRVDHAQIMEKVGKITGQVRALLGASVAEMARAVTQAQMLGMELDGVRGSMMQLLDFETSIGNELEAELLTGKQLNLERARSLALMGDMEGFMKEIAKQAGTFSEFTDMNVLQQNALAKAFGMSVDEMSDMLLQQEIAGRSAEELRAIGREDLAQIVEKRDLQQQFNDAVMKLKEIFVSIVGGPVGQFLIMIADIATTIIGLLSPLFKVLQSIANIVSQSKVLQFVILGIVAIMNANTIMGWFGGGVAAAKRLGAALKDMPGKLKNLSGMFKGMGKDAMDAFKKASGGAKDLSKGIVFDKRMAGGGRFRDTATGKLVSEDVANKAGVFKPGTQNIGKQAAESTKDGAKVASGSKGISTGLKELAEGLKAMGQSGVFKGILAVALAGPAFLLAVPAIPFLAFMGLTPLTQLSKNFIGLAAGLNAMGTGKQFVGIAVIGALGIAGALAVAAIPFLAFIGLAGPLVNVGLRMLASGLQALGGAAANPKVWLAVGLLGAVGVALIPFGVALALAGAAAYMFGLGIQAALEPIPPVINAVADAIVRIIGAFGDFVMQIAELDITKLLALGPSLAMIGVGVAALGVSMLLAAPGLLLLKFVAVPALKSLATVAEPMQQTADALKAITETMVPLGKSFMTLMLASLMAGPALASLGLGLIALSTATIFAAPGLFLLKLLGLPVFDAIGKAAPSLDIAAQSIEKLAKNVDNMYKIAGGLASMAGGLSLMAASLLLLTPFLPTLAAVSAFTGIGESITGTKDEKAEGENESTKTVSLDDETMKKMAELVANAVSKVKVQPRVSTDIWAEGNRNASGNYQSQIQNQTKLA